MIGTTEFRSEMPKLLKVFGKKKVILMKRGEPVGIFLNFSDYQKQEAWQEEFEDVVLGYLAKERDERSTDADFISEEEAWEKLKQK
jgi:hypothetical protein